MKSVRKLVSQIPIKNKLTDSVVRSIKNQFFPGSSAYWEERYKMNGNSGMGSYGKNALYKAGVINDFVKTNSIKRVIDFGCGDGNQLKYFDFPLYFGLDVSPTAIKLCEYLFKNDASKQFALYQEENNKAIANRFEADLSISLDVIFHLVEDTVFEKYMKSLFNASSKFVIIYAWDVDDKLRYHVRQRNFSKWVESNIENFKLEEIIENNNGDNFCNFFVYERF